MPGELFSAYEEACEHEAHRRYDLAHELYYRALEYDPMNTMLRLQLGQLQEKLKMFLEALATYTAMESIAETTAHRRGAGLYSRSAERERARALTLARYRRALLLGEGSFVKGWSSPDGCVGERAARRTALRDQIMPWLEARLSTSAGEAPVDLLKKSAEGEPLAGEAPKALHQALTRCATAEVTKLRHELPLAWRLSRSAPLTGRALKLTKLCIDERGKVASPTSGSPSPIEYLEKKVHKIERPFPLFRRQTLQRWEEHYNAACLFAIPLLYKPPTDSRRDRAGDDGGASGDLYAERAIERLELAAACADSSFFARQRDWLTTEDPDLDGLRQHALFKAFEAQYLPAARPAAPRPLEEQELVETRCTRDLLIAAAREWERVWRARAEATRAPPPTDSQHWWKDEHEVWRHLHEVAVNRDWQARLGLVNAARGWHASYGTNPLEPVFTRYEQQALHVDGDGLDLAATKEIEETCARLDAVARTIGSPGNASRAFRGFTYGISVLEAYDADPALLAPFVRAKLCARTPLSGVACIDGSSSPKVTPRATTAAPSSST